MQIIITLNLSTQEVLHQMGQEEARTDFLAGTNGAVQLEPENINQLDAFFKLVTPTRTEGQPLPEFNVSRCIFFFNKYE